jgi:hypothetical protein
MRNQASAPSTVIWTIGLETATGHGHGQLVLELEPE